MLTHITDSGLATMVDVSPKDMTERVAIARGIIQMKSATIALVEQGLLKKGNVLNVAQIAGFLAAKKTSDLIPLAHNIEITGCDIKFEIKKTYIEIEACVKANGKTGVEMEALTAVSLAALTIYDMCKAVDKDMQITDICLIKKTGGKSGDYLRE